MILNDLEEFYKIRKSLNVLVVDRVVLALSFVLPSLSPYQSFGLHRNPSTHQADINGSKCRCCSINLEISDF